MFGLDQLFDFDRNGKLDAFEQAARLDFLDTVDSDLRIKESGRTRSAYDSDTYTGKDNDNGKRRK